MPRWAAGPPKCRFLGVAHYPTYDATMTNTERRHKRSANTTRALCYQLSASLSNAKLQGLVLADDDGVCLAAAGDNRACNEIAAHLPLLGRKVNEFEGILFGPEAQWDVQMRRFDVEGSNLYLCAIGGSEVRNDQLEQSLGGVARILMPAA